MSNKDNIYLLYDIVFVVKYKIYIFELLMYLVYLLYGLYIMEKYVCKYWVKIVSEIKKFELVFNF